MRFNFFNNELLKNISVLASGTIIAQIIPIALQPFLRRQFPAQDYGAYAVYTSLVGILIIISSFKYELAIILPRKEKEATRILFLSQLINFSFNIILLLIIIIWHNQLAIFLNIDNKYKIFIFFIPLGTFLYNFYQAINYWLIREKNFVAISKNKIARRATEGTVQTIFSISKNQLGLILGDISGHIINVLAGLYQASKTNLRLNSIKLSELIEVAKKYIEYPKINLIPSLMSAGSFLLPTLLINKFFSTEYAGFFDLSKLILAIPLALIAGSVSNVLLQKINENLKNNKSLMSELLPLAKIISLIAITEILIILLFGENLFGFFFGEKNTFSGKIAEILVWSDAMGFINASFSSIFIAMKKIKYLSIWQVFYFTAIISLFFLNHLPFINFLEIYVILKAFSLFISILIMINIVYNYEKNLKNKILKK